jgi:hypothetical protein
MLHADLFFRSLQTVLRSECHQSLTSRLEVADQSDQSRREQGAEGRSSQEREPPAEQMLVRPAVTRDPAGQPATSPGL